MVTAVVLRSFLDSVQRDKQTRQLWNGQRTRQLMPALVSTFEQMGEDMGGKITFAELAVAPAKVKEELENLRSADSLADVFEALDADSSIEKEREESFEGARRLIYGNEKLDLVLLLSMMRSVRDDIKRTIGHLEETATLQADGKGYASGRSSRRRISDCIADLFDGVSACEGVPTHRQVSDVDPDTWDKYGSRCRF
ncbi:unnamed protein product [Prorocentrum cordatum]|uniref:Uncharacterized protein n=1 Tax=Prorocentrum cordatum TaxID=2364126 RepID=A0ABN9PGX1_9DINO|nr:unnamed protein product [Polarella glacialis]